MTSAELISLSPYFKQGERYANGSAIDWSVMNFNTMQLAFMLRRKWEKPIVVVRGPHPNRPEAADFECIGLPLRIVAMDVLRLPAPGAGVYSAGSFHIDSRPLGARELPKRWMAVRPHEENILHYEGLDHLITSKTSEWLYLEWSDEDSMAALAVVCRLSDLNNPPPPPTTTAV